MSQTMIQQESRVGSVVSVPRLSHSPQWMAQGWMRFMSYKISFSWEKMSLKKNKNEQLTNGTQSTPAPLVSVFRDDDLILCRRKVGWLSHSHLLGKLAPSLSSQVSPGFVSHLLSEEQQSDHSNVFKISLTLQKRIPGHSVFPSAASDPRCQAALNI